MNRCFFLWSRGLLACTEVFIKPFDPSTFQQADDQAFPKSIVYSELIQNLSLLIMWHDAAVKSWTHVQAENMELQEQVNKNIYLTTMLTGQPKPYNLEEDRTKETKSCHRGRSNAWMLREWTDNLQTLTRWEEKHLGSLGFGSAVGEEKQRSRKHRKQTDWSHYVDIKFSNPLKFTIFIFQTQNSHKENTEFLSIFDNLFKAIFQTFRRRCLWVDCEDSVSYLL